MRKIIMIGLLLLPGLALARMEDRTEELYKAVDANDLAGVRLILEESGQNVNVAYDENDTTPLMLACRHGNVEMVRLLLAKGADVAAVDAGGRPVMEYLRKDSQATFKKLRALILKAAAEKKIILPFNWDEISVSDCYNFTATASYPSILPVENLTDGNPRTAWAGKTGDEVWLFINGGASSVTVVNGYNKAPALFRANNRVKLLAVSVWAAAHFAGSVSEISRMFNVARLTPDHVLPLKDSGAKQYFPLPFNWEDIRRSNAEALAALVKRGDFKDRELIYSYFVLRAEPLTVYRGTKYDDTCISELKAGGPWLHEARLKGDWVAVSGTDAQSVTFSGPEDNRAFSSYLKEKPFLSGIWRMKNGELLIEAGGETRRYTPALDEKGAERLLKLTDTGGKLEIYKYRSR
ncbi:MAG: ankyrin repeat domain-containing protein [Elusimicrobiota bacterium]|nr:ankyrin repeat domain-containing protein [Elusimicrobiota bacterium]